MKLRTKLNVKKKNEKKENQNIGTKSRQKMFDLKNLKKKFVKKKKMLKKVNWK